MFTVLLIVIALVPTFMKTWNIREFENWFPGHGKVRNSIGKYLFLLSYMKYESSVGHMVAAHCFLLLFHKVGHRMQVVMRALTVLCLDSYDITYMDKKFMHCCFHLYFGLYHHCMLNSVHLQFQNRHLDHSLLLMQQLLISETASNYPVEYLAHFRNLHLIFSRLLEADARFSADCSPLLPYILLAGGWGFRIPFMVICVSVCFWWIVAGLQTETTVKIWDS